MSDKEFTYAKAGVDREKEEETVNSILEIIRTTYQGRNRDEGHYAASIPLGNHLLSLTTDGVGSKVLLAQEFQQYNTIGIDCVAMNVNDLICIGSIPVAFVDYIAIRKSDDTIIQGIVEGLANGCMEAEIPLIGGETALLPDILSPIRDDNGFDVAGTALGIHEQRTTIDGSNIKSGDVIIGILSSGIHSNGLTLARKVVKDKSKRRELLKPTRIYVKAIKELLNSKIQGIHGIAHITGGGFTNLMRLGEFEYRIELKQIPDIFLHIKEVANLSDRELFRTFNSGIGMCIIADPASTEHIMSLLNRHYPTQMIGHISEGKRVVVNSIQLT